MSKNSRWKDLVGPVPGPHLNPPPAAPERFLKMEEFT